MQGESPSCNHVLCAYGIPPLMWAGFQKELVLSTVRRSLTGWGLLSAIFLAYTCLILPWPLLVKLLMVLAPGLVMLLAYSADLSLLKKSVECAERALKVVGPTTEHALNLLALCALEYAKELLSRGMTKRAAMLTLTASKLLRRIPTRIQYREEWGRGIFVLPSAFLLLLLGVVIGSVAISQALVLIILYQSRGLEYLPLGVAAIALPMVGLMLSSYRVTPKGEIRDLFRSYYVLEGTPSEEAVREEIEDAYSVLAEKMDIRALSSVFGREVGPPRKPSAGDTGHPEPFGWSAGAP